MSDGTAQNFGNAGLVLPAAQNARISRLLLLLILLGGTIAFIDGVTSRYNDDWEYDQTETLTYQPAAAAMIFALLTLPVAFHYFRQQHATSSEAIVLCYLLGVTAYTKDFAYLKIPGIPLYITDYVLAFLLVRYFFWPSFRWYSLRSWPMLSAAALLIIGFVAAVRGVIGGQSVLLVVRDFGLVAYVLFLPVGILLVKNWASIKRVVLVFCVGSAILSLHAIGYAASNPGQRRYILYPVLLAGAFVASFAGLQNKIFERKLGWFLTGATGFGLLLANARTEFVAVLGACGLMFLLGPSVKRSSIIHRLRNMAAFAFVGIVLFGILLQTKSGSTMATRITDDFVMGVLNPSEDPTAQFRFLAWAEAINRFFQQPILGEGYGIPFTFDEYNSDPRPHNTYLTFLYKTGAVGFIVLGGVLGIFFYKVFIGARRHREDRNSALPYIVGLALIAVSATGLFTFVFESPFVSAPYWLLVAVGYRSLYLLGSSLTVGQSA
jgi:O-antigen ligase